MTTTVVIPPEMSYDGTQHTYTDDSDPTTGLDGGGHVDRFAPAIKDVVSVTNYAATKATEAAASASSASSSATASQNYADAIKGTSTSSIVIGTGSKTFTTQSSKQFASGQFVTISSQANPANYMFGQITSYSATTLIVNVTSVGGSGTLSDWNISISGIKGDTGAAGAVNSGNPTNITGLVKGNGSTVSAATAETDYVTPSGVGTLSGKTITGLKLIKTAPTISAGVVTLDLAAANFFSIALTSNITSFTLTNVPSTFFEFAIELIPDGTARTVTWTFSGAAARWASNTAPTLTSTNAKRDTFVFYSHDSFVNICAFKAGQNL